MESLDTARLDQLARERAAEFATAAPFPHVVIDEFLAPDVAEACSQDFSAAERGWKHYHHYNERKLALTDLTKMPPRTRALFEDLQGDAFVDFVSRLSGIDDLISDPDLEGAGMHLVRPGGFLNVHTDFLTHSKKPSWRRMINILIYLNKDWEESWQGNLELWDADLENCVQSIAPVFNRCVIFATVPNSYHGHPHKLACPEGMARKGLLLYYYVDEGHDLELTSTDYRALPGDSRVRKLMVAADRLALRAYTLLKRRSRLSDDWVEKILRRF